jgi:hypothetical protein
MAIKIGPKGWIEIITTGVGPQRKLKLGTFFGRGAAVGDTGFCDAPFFRATEPPIAIIDMNRGRNVTTSFGGVVTGGISQVDTGGLGADGTMSGHTMLAIIGDTGTAGL